ncbi:hypothetical protein Tco_1186199 [Tanacetum coccineum]
MKKWKGRFFFIDRRAIPDAMCWRHHDSDIINLLFKCCLAVTWEFPKFYPLFKDPEGNVITMSGNFASSFLSGMTSRLRALTEQDVIPSTYVPPTHLAIANPGKNWTLKQRVESSDPRIVANEDKKKRKAFPHIAAVGSWVLFAPSLLFRLGESIKEPVTHVRQECRDFNWLTYSSWLQEESHLLDNNIVLGYHAEQRPSRSRVGATNKKCRSSPFLLVVRNLEKIKLAQKDSALVIAESFLVIDFPENEALRTQLAFAKREKTDAIKKLLPTVVGRLLQSHEYKQSLSVPFNYALQTGWGQGLAEARSEGELREIMMRMNGFDAYSERNEWLRVYEDLLKLHPAPPPKDAPKAGSGGIAFAPKLVRAAEVAGSKDTASQEISKSKTGPSLQNPTSFAGVPKPSVWETNRAHFPEMLLYPVWCLTLGPTQNSFP